ncbi:MAG: phenylalanine--tRNA ligase subunit alpha, partial [Xanthomonadales bacterium]|nr:phenylalanine--tRNA ligase subunit alpha [Xanthomonadales bacterium]
MNLDDLLSAARTRIEAAADPGALEALRVEFLGKSGSITAQLKALGALAPEERKQRGAEVNRVRDAVAEALTARKASLDAASLGARLQRERIDVTLPGRQVGSGGLHPITRALERIVGIFEHMGYTVADGPEIEDDWHNFEALNFPPHHP